MQETVSAIPPPRQVDKVFALGSQTLHGVQTTPSPKYPELHVHTTVSELPTPVHRLVFFALLSQVLHAKQFEPLP